MWEAKIWPNPAGVLLQEETRTDGAYKGTMLIIFVVSRCG